MKTSDLSPSDLMDTIGDLGDILRDRLKSSVSEIKNIEGQWDQLGRMCAQRDDHAENLLKRVKSELSRLGRFCEICCEKIEGSMSDGT